MPEFTGARARALRTRHGWSLQFLAQLSSVNKAYLSEFENGIRQLPQEMLARVRAVLEAPPTGHARPALRDRDGHNQLVFLDPHTGAVSFEPQGAWLEWEEDDGRVMRMWVGPRASS